MPSDEEWAQAQEKIEWLTNQMLNLQASAMGRALLDKTPRIPFKTAFSGPNGVRYVLVRQAGGAAAFVAAPANDSDWSDA